LIHRRTTQPTLFPYTTLFRSNQLVSIQSNFSAEQPYSEVFIMRGNVHGVYRLETPPEVFWAYQTEGSKNQELMNYYEDFGDMERSEEHTSELQSRENLVCRLL